VARAAFDEAVRRSPAKLVTLRQRRGCLRTAEGQTRSNDLAKNIAAGFGSWSHRRLIGCRRRG
jgi:hypothetical protein